MSDERSFLVRALAAIAADVALLGLSLLALATLICLYEKYGTCT